jgi:hypothetical protein
VFGLGEECISLVVKIEDLIGMGGRNCGGRRRGDGGASYLAVFPFLALDPLSRAGSEKTLSLRVMEALILN